MKSDLEQRYFTFLLFSNRIQFWPIISILVHFLRNYEQNIFLLDFVFVLLLRFKTSIFESMDENRSETRPSA